MIRNKQSNKKKMMKTRGFVLHYINPKDRKLYLTSRILPKKKENITGKKAENQKIFH